MSQNPYIFELPTDPEALGDPEECNQGNWDCGIKVELLSLIRDSDSSDVRIQGRLTTFYADDGTHEYNECSGDVVFRNAVDDNWSFDDDWCDYDDFGRSMGWRGEEAENIFGEGGTFWTAEDEMNQMVPNFFNSFIESQLQK